MRDHGAAEDSAAGNGPEGVGAAVRGQAPAYGLQPSGLSEAEPSWPMLQTFALVRVLVATCS